MIYRLFTNKFVVGALTLASLLLLSMPASAQNVNWGNPGVPVPVGGGSNHYCRRAFARHGDICIIPEKGPVQNDCHHGADCWHTGNGYRWVFDERRICTISCKYSNELWNGRSNEWFKSSA